MELEDLDFESESYYEDEQVALARLPRDESGLDRLLDYLYRTDSFYGYMYLFDEFGDILEASVAKIREAENKHPQLIQIMDALLVQELIEEDSDVPLLGFDIYGNEVELEHLITAEHLDTYKKYVFYTANHSGENCSSKVYVAELRKTDDGNSAMLCEVETEEEWTFLQDIFNSVLEDFEPLDEDEHI